LSFREEEGALYMANPLLNEKELFERIKEEKIILPPSLWDFLYKEIADNITGINIICEYYLEHNQPIPPKEAEKIIFFSQSIGDTIKNITFKEIKDFPFPEIKEDAPLHPVVKEMLTHYIGNDTQVINVIVGAYTEQDMPQPVPQEMIPKILEHCRLLVEFMERLRKATTKDNDFLEKEK
jgi:hypothetical protein